MQLQGVLLPDFWKFTKLLRQPLPLGRSDFMALRHDGCIYVDKTRMIFGLSTFSVGM